MVKQKNIVSGLDSLRFIMAFIVLLGHYPNPFSTFLKHQGICFNIIGDLLSVSFCGVGAVIAFFIISGFVIHLPNVEKFGDLKKYFIRRYIRILMPLFVITVISYSYHCFYSIPIWSLYCELFYYTIYPFLYIITKGKWKYGFIASLIFSYIIILIFASSDVLSLVHQKNLNFNGAYWQFGSLFTWVIGLPCWLLGVLLADNINKSNNIPIVSFLRIITFRVVIFCFSIILVTLRFHFFFSYLLSMNLFAIPLFYWIKNEVYYYKTRKPVSILEFLGKFSYSIYLCHGVSLFICLKYMQMNLYTYFIILFIGLCSSNIFFVLVEKPSHKLAVYLSNKI